MAEKTDHNPTEETTEEKILPLVAPCRQVEMTAPFRWLKKGWEDFRRAPGHSLGFGVVMTLLSVLITIIAYKVGSFTMVIVMMAGFIFVGPAIAMGLYSVSCQLEKNNKVDMISCLRQSKKRIGNQMIMAFALLIVFMVWARAASMVHIFLPMTANPDPLELIKFIVIGSVIGLLFSMVIFSATAFALPMILDRDVDAITAMISSFNAVLKNKAAMLLWAMIILASVLVGFATFFIGLMFTLPIIGHATWHGYRETIVGDDWPQDSHTKLPSSQD